MLKSMSLKSLVVTGAAALTIAGQAHAYEPARSAECIAPANPGGGWDFTCRSVGKALTGGI